MLPSQTDFRAFRVSVSRWLVLGKGGFLLQLTVQPCRLSVRSLCSTELSDRAGDLFLDCCCLHALRRVAKGVHPLSFVTCYVRYTEASQGKLNNFSRS